MINKKITVVTVCYNAADRIEQTIISVLNQTYDNIEYIIIDGGSTDGTVDTIRRYSNRITYWVSEKDGGIYDAMNKGISIATGQYINFMNAGDTFYSSETLKILAGRIDNNAIIIYGDCNVKFRGSVVHKKPLKIDYLNTKLPFCHQSMLVDVSFHKKHLYSTKLKIASDYKFVYDAYYKNNVKLQYIPITVSTFDSTDGVSSHNFITSMNEKFEIWGIENNFIYKFPWYFATLRMYLSLYVRRYIPTRATVFIRKFTDSLRSHQ